LNCLLDTHLLIWAMDAPDRLTNGARQFLERSEMRRSFSLASIWEVSIKFGLGRLDFEVEPQLFREILLDNGFTEYPITPEAIVQVSKLPPIHRDPFDRLLVAQAMTEKVTLITLDKTVASYPGSILKL
jgi:PIN domain nuclease of toxin-antitoxin system